MGKITADHIIKVIKEKYVQDKVIVLWLMAAPSGFPFYQALIERVERDRFLREIIKKTHFLQSIPYALNDLKWILENVNFSIQIPALLKVFENLLKAPKLKKFKDKEGRKSTLTVSINSFSYKHGIPDDPSGHGGGYVFDSRVITNPGRLEEYKYLTGKDKPVVDFLNQQGDVNEFLGNAFSLVDMSVDKYEERNFSHLMVSFGCTGGQHRSVYCAERLREHLRESQSVQITLWHRELD